MSAEGWGVVAVPVTDLRSVPGVLASSHTYDSFQESQLLYGEIVKIVKEELNWLKVEAIEQSEFSHEERWQGYPGWIKKSSVVPFKSSQVPNFVVQSKIALFFSSPNPKSKSIPLSIGTKIVGLGKIKNGFRKVRGVKGETGWILDKTIRPSESILSEELTRKKIVESASELIGDPYFWGGRSAYITELKGQITAVDCSGLVNLAYRVAGIEIPRDSHEQFMKAKKIKKEELKTGDLIFSASAEQPEKISHVAIFVDEKVLIEAPRTGETVRQIEFDKKFGVPFNEIEEGTPLDGRILRFGTYF